MSTRTFTEHEAASVVAALSDTITNSKAGAFIYPVPGNDQGGDAAKDLLAAKAIEKRAYKSQNKNKLPSNVAAAVAIAAAREKSEAVENKSSGGGSNKGTKKHGRGKSHTFFSASRKKRPPPVFEDYDKLDDNYGDATSAVFVMPEFKPAPFFYYSDHSPEPDDDTLTPLTLPGRIPSFPAKMHAILENPDLHDVVSWAPHGRSWRILKPREFEVAVLPKYFEHSKFSSFVRQSNGWGFRRMSQGRDRNAYYHEYFLRGMPWLCKKMRRPKVAEKKALDPEHEPDLLVISRMHPIQQRTELDREVIMLLCTIEGGPRARMPVHCGLAHASALSIPPAPTALKTSKGGAADRNETRDGALAPLSGLNVKPAAVSNAEVNDDLKPAAVPNHSQRALNQPHSAPPVKNYTITNNAITNHAPQLPTPSQSSLNSASADAMSHNNRSTSQGSQESNFTETSMNQQNVGNLLSQFTPETAATICGNNGLPADPQFAAGFMAAVALHTNQLRSMQGQAFVANTTHSNGAKSDPTPVVVAPSPAASIPIASHQTTNVMNAAASINGRNNQSLSFASTANFSNGSGENAYGNVHRHGSNNNNYANSVPISMNTNAMSFPQSSFISGMSNGYRNALLNGWFVPNGDLNTIPILLTSNNTDSPNHVGSGNRNATETFSPNAGNIGHNPNIM